VLELRAGPLAAAFHPEASMLCSSLTSDGEELLGLRGGIEAYVERGKTMGIPLLHPWANRLSDYAYGQVELDRDAPGLRDDGEGHPLHGLVHGRAAFDVVAHDETSLTARLDFGAHPEWLRSFPFPHVLEVSVDLEPGGLTHRTTLRNTGVIGVPVAFGWHPYVAGEHEPVDEPSSASSYVIGRVRMELLEGYTNAHLFSPPDEAVVAFEPMTSPVDALRTGRGLRHVAPGGSFTAAFRLAVDLAARPAP
jgi:aldose 1-epimerase